MLLGFVLHNPVAAVLLWAAVYVGDYYLTLYGARLYRSGPHEHLAFEGSYELTPYYERDINLMRRLSTRFVLALAFSVIVLFGLWLIGERALGLNWPLEFALGALVLREAAVYLRHFRNITMFRMARQPGALTGKLTYPRWFLLRSSAVELLSFAGLCLFLAALLGGWFLLGGAVACAITGFQHLRRAGQAALIPPVGAAAGATAAPEPAEVEPASQPPA